MFKNQYIFFTGPDETQVEECDDDTTQRYSKLLNQLFHALDKSKNKTDRHNAVSEFLSLLKAHPLTKQLYNRSPTQIEGLKLLDDIESIKAFTVGIPMPTGDYLSYDTRIKPSQ